MHRFETTKFFKENHHNYFILKDQEQDELDDLLEKKELTSSECLRIAKLFGFSCLERKPKLCFEYLEKANNIDPNNSNVYLYLYRAEIRFHNNKEKAIEYLLKAVNLRNPEAIYKYSLILKRNKDINYESMLYESAKLKYYNAEIDYYYQILLPYAQTNNDYKNSSEFLRNHLNNYVLLEEYIINLFTGIESDIGIDKQRAYELCETAIQKDDSNENILFISGFSKWEKKNIFEAFYYFQKLYFKWVNNAQQYSISLSPKLEINKNLIKFEKDNPIYHNVFKILPTQKRTLDLIKFEYEKVYDVASIYILYECSDKNIMNDCLFLPGSDKELLEQQADLLTQPDAQGILAKVYIKYEKIWKLPNPRTIGKLLLESFSRGSRVSLEELYFSLLFGVYNDQNYELAYEVILESNRLGEKNALVYKGYCEWYGLGTEKNIQQAEKDFLFSIIENENVLAMTFYGALLIKRNENNDFSKGLKLIRQACFLNQPDALYIYGRIIYDQGDYERALKLFNLSVKQNNQNFRFSYNPKRKYVMEAPFFYEVKKNSDPNFIVLLAYCKIFGLGCSPDPFEFVSLLKEGVERKNEECMMKYYILFIKHNESKQKDYLNVMKYLSEKGNKRAKFEVGYCYHIGHGTSPNPGIAEKIFSELALDGNGDAAFLLSKKYYMSDPTISWGYSKIAKENGTLYPPEYLKLVGVTLYPIEDQFEEDSAITQYVYNVIGRFSSFLVYANRFSFRFILGFAKQYMLGYRYPQWIMYFLNLLSNLGYPEAQDIYFFNFPKNISNADLKRGKLIVHGMMEYYLEIEPNREKYFEICKSFKPEQEQIYRALFDFYHADDSKLYSCSNIKIDLMDGYGLNKIEAHYIILNLYGRNYTILDNYNTYRYAYQFVDSFCYEMVAAFIHFSIVGSPIIHKSYTLFPQFINIASYNTYNGDYFTQLGVLYLYGISVDVDTHLAKHYFEKGEEYGSLLAKVYLARKFYNNQPEIKMRLLREASHLMNADAMFFLGLELNSNDLILNSAIPINWRMFYMYIDEKPDPNPNVNSLPYAIEYMKEKACLSKNDSEKNVEELNYTLFYYTAIYNNNGTLDQNIQNSGRDDNIPCIYIRNNKFNMSNILERNYYSVWSWFVASNELKQDIFSIIGMHLLCKSIQLGNMNALAFSGSLFIFIDPDRAMQCFKTALEKSENISAYIYLKLMSHDFSPFVLKEAKRHCLDFIVNSLIDNNINWKVHYNICKMYLLLTSDDNIPDKFKELAIEYKDYEALMWISQQYQLNSQNNYIDEAIFYFLEAEKLKQNEAPTQNLDALGLNPSKQVSFFKRY